MELNTVKVDMLTVEPEVVAYLRGNVNSFDAAVTKDHVVFYVRSKEFARLLNHLFRLVRRYAGQEITKIQVSPVEFDNWKNSTKGIVGNTKSGVIESPSTATSKIEANLDWVFNQAIEGRASDVYLFINETGTRLEMKTHGYKRHICNFDPGQGYQLVNKMWSMGKSTYDKSKPCDASFSHDYKEQVYRVRANSLRTNDGGNTIACRIRDPKEIRPINELGYCPEQVAAIADMCAAAGGLILFTGATNSGKSTSVTSLMYMIPDTDHVIEMADPIEIEMGHITQVNIDRHHKDHIEMFNAMLGSLVRQNPDVLVLGEIRDQRSAEAATNMAIQGKRVYSTLHTTTAPGVFSRLSGLGVPDHVLAMPDFISGIVSQNLVPVACTACGLDYAGGLELYGDFEMKKTEGLQLDNLRFINPEGCKDCMNGTSGQTLVAEVHPLVRDTGAVHEIIEAKKFHQLGAYMRKHHDVITKHEHAIGKMNCGEIDPIASFKIIGLLPSFDKSRLVPKKVAERYKTKAALQVPLVVHTKEDVEKKGKDKTIGINELPPQQAEIADTVVHSAAG